MVLHDFEADTTGPFQHSIPIHSIQDLAIASEGVGGHFLLPLFRNPLLFILGSLRVNPTPEIIGLLSNKFGHLPSVPAQCLMAVSYLLSRILPELISSASLGARINDKTGVHVEIRSVGLPIGAGLGSSAALSVAIAGALLRLRMKLDGSLTIASDSHLIISSSLPQANDTKTLDYDESSCACPHWLLASVNAWAYASEIVIHGTPSGLDNTTSCFGGAMKYSKISGQFEQLEKLPALNVILTNTKVPRSTKQLVAGVRVKYDRFPDVMQPVLDSIEAISRRFLRLVDQ
jgi:mevalonate kinase